MEIVNGLWLGRNLTELEFMTMNSFTSFGHEFHLWHYWPLNTKPIRGNKKIIIRDAREILPEDRIFKYPDPMILGFGENSYVGLSEIFRYKVLYELGGWWSDMDVTCLKSLDEIETPYFFRFHGVLSIVGNIMKCPPNSELMKLCWDRANKEINETTTDWHLAIRFLCYYVEFLGLDKYIRNDSCNLDRLENVKPYLSVPGNLSDIPDHWNFIHWMNSVMKMMPLNSQSVYNKLIDKHCKHNRILI
jgi:hypothetical protein